MNKQPRMTDEEAIEVIKKNYPPENYTMLREALNIAIESLGKVDPIPLPTIKPEETEGYSDKNIGFIRGVAYAARLIKQYDTNSEHLIQESGITEDELRKYADDYDLGNLGILEITSLEVNPNE